MLGSRRRRFRTRRRSLGGGWDRPRRRADWKPERPPREPSGCMLNARESFERHCLSWCVSALRRGHGKRKHPGFTAIAPADLHAHSPCGLDVRNCRSHQIQRSNSTSIISRHRQEVKRRHFGSSVVECCEFSAGSGTLEPLKSAKVGIVRADSEQRNVRSRKQS